MTDKPIIKLKPMEDVNEKIIKEKGNTKCIFYSDNICRKGDKTRDCVNCARVEYHSLFSLNWDNQERLQKIINQKEKKCKELKEDRERWESDFEETNTTKLVNKVMKLEQTLTEIKDYCNKYPQNSIGFKKQILQKISEVKNERN